MVAFNWQRIYIFELFIPAGLVGNGVRYYSPNPGRFVGHKSSKDFKLLITIRHFFISEVFH